MKELNKKEVKYVNGKGDEEINPHWVPPTWPPSLPPIRPPWFADKDI